MKHSLIYLSVAALSVLAPAVLPPAAMAQGSAVNGKFAGIPATRLWLPDSREYLRPQLELAVLRAQQNEECVEVLYASLNEYRTAHEEPSFTILCRRDYRSTFNLVFRISTLDPTFAKLPDPVEQDGEDKEAMEASLQLLRERLGREDLLAPFEPEPAEAAAAPEPAPVDELDLDLDLEEMLRVPISRPEPDPDIF